MNPIDETYEFLKKAGTYYLATVDIVGNPKLRPFGTYSIINNELYIQTSNKKEVFKEILNHPHIQICSFFQGKWIRLDADAYHIDDVNIRKQILDDQPSLRKMYDENDGKCAAIVLRNCRAEFCSFVSEPRIVTF